MNENIPDNWGQLRRREQETLKKAKATASTIADNTERVYHWAGYEGGGYDTRARYIVLSNARARAEMLLQQIDEALSVQRELGYDKPREEGSQP